jgi:hypothetical protein
MMTPLVLSYLDSGPMSDSEFRARGGSWIMKRYAFSRAEATEYIRAEDRASATWADTLAGRIEAFCRMHGACTSSPLVRGYALDLARSLNRGDL